MSGVRFEHVSKRFGDNTAVDDLSLTVEDREFMVLLGPSGCGKTTALRMIAGLDSISGGEVYIGDRLVNDLAASDRDIAMVFQSYALYPHMTVRKNIESPLVARRGNQLSAAERDARVSEAADTLGLGELLSRKPGELSGGQRQRVALARSIVRRPEVFLMDEPLSNLDAKLRTQTRLELVELWRRLETTFIYVTHDQIEAMTMASRIAVMSAGRLQQVGAPQAVYERPANIFVASFIGSPPMNLASGTVSGPASVAVGVGAVNVSDLGSAAEGQAVTVGIRPEHVSLAPTSDAAGLTPPPYPAPTSGTIEGTVISVELLGHERHVICQVADARWIARQEADAPMFAPGDPVSLGIDPRHVHLFDTASTERLN